MKIPRLQNTPELQYRIFINVTGEDLFATRTELFTQKYWHAQFVFLDTPEQLACLEKELRTNPSYDRLIVYPGEVVTDIFPRDFNWQSYAAKTGLLSEDAARKHYLKK